LAGSAVELGDKRGMNLGFKVLDSFLKNKTDTATKRALLSELAVVETSLAALAYHASP
jgi:hypothetical protein